MNLKAGARQIMRDAIALRRVRSARDRSLDRDDALGKAAVARRRREALEADTKGPEAEQVKSQERRDQDQDGAARNGVRPDSLGERLQTE